MKTSLLMRRALAVLAVCLVGFSASAQVYINEVLADNEGVYEVDGEFPDYIELINTNMTTSLNIADWRLTKDTSRLNDHRYTYRFPANSIIPPGGFLVVICDGNTNQRYHANVSIGKSGESLLLLGAQLGTRDSVKFGFQVADHSLGRVGDGPGPTNVWTLCQPTPDAANVAVSFTTRRSGLRINEWAPSRGDEDDWLELYNADPEIVSLAYLVFTDRTNTGFGPLGCTNRATVPYSWIAPGDFIQFFADDHAEQGNDQLDFKMTSLGMAGNPPESVMLLASNRVNIIHQVFWTNAALGESYGWLPDGNTNVVVKFAPGKDTPGDSNFLPLENVLINEILAHTDLPLEDAIELYNPTTTNVNIGGWWLSDDKTVYNKFRIPDGTIIPPNGYLVFYEYLGVPGGFNPSGDGVFPSFSLSSARGDDVYLYATDPGSTNLNGFRRGVDFPASENGVSYGRYITSTGESDFVPLKRLTFGSDVTRTDPTNRITDFRAGMGATNSEPLLGPLVISEIMYHPPDFIEDTNIIQNELDEYVEIYNASTQIVRLWDTNVYPYPPFGYVYTNTWRVRGEIRFNFPTNVSLGPGRSLILVNFGLTNTLQLNRFRAMYAIPANVPIFGPYGGGALSDGGGEIEIERPDAPQPPSRPDAGFVPYLRVDKIRYDDDPPWPAEPDGFRTDPFNPNSVGYCLVRRKPEEYGGDLINWMVGAPSPGYQSISNSVTRAGNVVTISFWGLAGSGYTLQYKNALENATWQKLQDFPAQATTGARQVVANVAPGSRGFYRVVTPIQP